jgi:hypothetical protein
MITGNYAHILKCESATTAILDLLCKFEILKYDIDEENDVKSIPQSWNQIQKFVRRQVQSPS